MTSSFVSYWQEMRGNKMSQHDVAAALGVSETMVANWQRLGLISYERCERMALVASDDLGLFISRYGGLLYLYPGSEWCDHYQSARARLLGKYVSRETCGMPASSFNRLVASLKLAPYVDFGRGASGGRWFSRDQLEEYL